jgi:hypothetical protein
MASGAQRALVELGAIVQVYGAQPGVTIEVWPAQAPRAGEAGLDQ